jgi:hypothetical protein
MMPVFLWRFRERLRTFVPEGDDRRRLLGYLLAVAARISGDDLMAESSARLRPTSVSGVEALLESQAANSYATRRMLEAPDAEAFSWGFLLGPTNGYFETYFEKVRSL